MLSGFYSNKSEASDGIYGDDTKLTVEEFQKDNHISVDGVVGSNTLNFLINKTKEIQ
jgi:peptidoglycan hydrolase-like protein with peptidoglycan-binding domain